MSDDQNKNGQNHFAVNADSIKEEGKEELAEIKEKIDSDATTDWFYIFH